MVDGAVVDIANGGSEQSAMISGVFSGFGGISDELDQLETPWIRGVPVGDTLGVPIGDTSISEKFQSFSDPEINATVDAKVRDDSSSHQAMESNHYTRPGGFPGEVEYLGTPDFHRIAIGDTLPGCPQGCPQAKFRSRQG